MPHAGEWEGGGLVRGWGEWAVPWGKCLCSMGVGLWSWGGRAAPCWWVGGLFRGCMREVWGWGFVALRKEGGPVPVGGRGRACGRDGRDASVPFPRAWLAERPPSILSCNGLLTAISK